MLVIFPCADSEAYMVLNQDRTNKGPASVARRIRKLLLLQICAQRGSGYACVANASVVLAQRFATNRALKQALRWCVS